MANAKLIALLGLVICLIISTAIMSTLGIGRDTWQYRCLLWCHAACYICGYVRGSENSR